MYFLMTLYMYMKTATININLAFGKLLILHYIALYALQHLLVVWVERGILAVYHISDTN